MEKKCAQETSVDFHAGVYISTYLAILHSGIVSNFWLISEKFLSLNYYTNKTSRKNCENIILNIATLQFLKSLKNILFIEQLSQK